MASPESVCPLCSKPIGSGRHVYFEHGELFHLACRARAVHRRALDLVEDARTAKARAATLMADLERRRQAQRRMVLPSRTRSRAGPCPVCGEAARHTDWRPRLPWVAIERCPCGGFFVEAVVLEWRLPALGARERRELSASIRGHRARRQEVWLTVDPDVSSGSTGRLTIRTRRPAQW